MGALDSALALPAAIAALCAGIAAYLALEPPRARPWRQETLDRQPSAAEADKRLAAFAALAGAVIAFAVSGLPGLAAAGALAGATAVWVVRRRRSIDQARERDRALVELLRSVSSGVLSGMPLVAALAEGARYASPAIRGDVEIALRMIEAAIPVETAVDTLASRIGTPGAQRLREGATIAFHAGGPADKTFIALASIIEEACEADERRVQRTRGLRSQMHVILAMAPVLLFVCLSGFGPGVRAFYASGAGSLVLIGVAAGLLGARFWAERIITGPATTSREPE